MNRDTDLKKIRPNLNLANTDTKPLELFQNRTLRPILKLQQEFTFTLLQTHKNYKPIQSLKISRDQYEKLIAKFIQTNLGLKNQIIGAIIGLFTSDEINFYLTQKKELNRRIIQMQLKRFVDTIYSES